MPEASRGSEHRVVPEMQPYACREFFRVEMHLDSVPDTRLQISQMFGLSRQPAALRIVPVSYQQPGFLTATDRYCDIFRALSLQRNATHP
jgi:hypothetical protein